MGDNSPNTRNDNLYHNSVYLISSPWLYLVLISGLCIPFRWPVYWLLSGAPVLEAVLLLGAEGMQFEGQEEEVSNERSQCSGIQSDERRTRILSTFPLWPLATTLDLIYSVCSTSWLLYYLFSIVCWGIIPIVCLFQFPIAGKLLRRQLRKILLLKTFGLQFIDDRIGIFDVPGLEIDTNVDGLMVIRGMTFRMSDLSLRVHGVEVGLKLVMGEGVDEEEIEVGIACEEVVVRLGRGIEVGDCFASMKGGEGELSFKDAEEEIGGEKEGWKRAGNEVWEVDSKMLRAVEGNAFEYDNGNVQNELRTLEIDRNENTTVQGEMANRYAPKNTDLNDGIENFKTITPDDTQAANEQYNKTIQTIQSTNSIQICRQEVRRLLDSSQGNKESGTDQPGTVNENSNYNIRAAICSQLHRQPSITHPPSHSIKVTTLKTLKPPHIRSFLHRLPMLFRLLLSPIAYFHPVQISSLTATGSGKWIQEILSTKVFKTIINTPPTSPTSPTSKSHFHFHSSANPSPEDENTIPKIQESINAWLMPANFVLEFGSITGLAQVPFFTSYPIHCSLSTTDVMVYRTLPSTIKLKQVIRIGGADARFEIPSFLLPHHEHLLPSIPSQGEIREKGVEAREAREKLGRDGKMEQLVKENEREILKKDECTVRIGAHASLPAVMDQELLDWVARVVKASKVLEMEKEPSLMDEEVHGFREFMGAVKGGVKDVCIPGSSPSPSLPYKMK